jgi:hypothetical protein
LLRARKIERDELMTCLPDVLRRGLKVIFCGTAVEKKEAIGMIELNAKEESVLRHLKELRL